MRYGNVGCGITALLIVHLSAAGAAVRGESIVGDAMTVTTTSPRADTAAQFALYVSGAPCPEWEADRTFSQFQVNLGAETILLRGGLEGAGRGTEAALRAQDGRLVRLVTNASRADWLLTFPYVERGVAVLGRPVLRSDCSVDRGKLYVEALYPEILMKDPVDPSLDLRQLPGYSALRVAIDDYGEELRTRTRGIERGLIARLEDELFADEIAESALPWRIVLAGPETPLSGSEAVDLVLSGSDGGAGLFGHVAVGIDGQVYNVYPKGSERGAPTAVELGDYLFSAERGQALRRPSWILRIEGLPRETVDEIREVTERQIEQIETGERPYHPTRNNCVTACLRSLEPVGIKVSKMRYFTRRFPRPVFSKVLNELPRLAKEAGPDGLRVELWFVPQVGVRPLTGGAPNRPLWDRTSVN